MAIIIFIVCLATALIGAAITVRNIDNKLGIRMNPFGGKAKKDDDGFRDYIGP
jgi:hypothetical protein